MALILLSIQYEYPRITKWINSLESKLSEKQNIIAKEIIKELRKRVQFLVDVGLNYLSLNRSSKVFLVEKVNVFV